jgi:hypothetical protein
VIDVGSSSPQLITLHLRQLEGLAIASSWGFESPFRTGNSQAFLRPDHRADASLCDLCEVIHQHHGLIVT